MLPSALAIDSANSPTSLRIEFEGRDATDEIFRVDLTTPGPTVEHRFRSYDGTGLPRFFDDIGQAWKGWEGTKTWSSLEGEMTIDATHDGLGHISLRVDLYGDTWRADWHCAATLVIEPGMLDGICRQARSFS